MIEEKKTTEFLEAILKSTDPDKISHVMEKYSSKMIERDDYFSEYMRSTFALHKRHQKDIFIAADISEKYGYSLISTEKRTRRRDVIIKLCFAGHFTKDETDCALKLYGMSPLYARDKRDACLINALCSNLYEIADVNDILAANGFSTLYSSVD